MDTGRNTILFLQQSIGKSLDSVMGVIFEGRAVMKAGRTKVLFVFDGDLNVIDNGAASTTKNLIHHAPDHMDVYITSSREYDGFQDYVSVIKICETKQESLPVRILTSNTFRRNKMNHQIADCIQSFQSEEDAVIVFTAETNHRYCKYVKNKEKLFFYLGDLASAAFQIHTETTSGFLRKLFYWKEKIVSGLYEKNFPRRYKAVFLVNKNEAEYANAKYKTNRYRAIFAGFEPAERIDIAEHDNINLVFIGNMGFKPNKDGLDYFYQTVFKKLDNRYRLHLIGSGSDSIYKDDNRVTGHGFVNDFNDVLQYCDYGLCYMVNGGGLKNKILDYMKYGIPCIVNSYVKENTAPVRSKYLLTADTYEEFLTKTHQEYSREDVIESIKRYKMSNVAKLFWNYL